MCEVLCTLPEEEIQEIITRIEYQRFFEIVKKELKQNTNHRGCKSSKTWIARDRDFEGGSQYGGGGGGVPTGPVSGKSMILGPVSGKP